MRFRKRHIVLATFLAFALTCSWFLYKAVSLATSAEYALHATLLVFDLTRDYVISHEGAWPRQWQDLETLPARKGPMFNWPKDKEEVGRYVWVDFKADPTKLAAESVESFDAIRPLGPHYPYKHYGSVAELLDAIRRGMKIANSMPGASSHENPGFGP